MKFKTGDLIIDRNDERIEYIVVSSGGWFYYIYPLKFYDKDRIQYGIQKEYINHYYRLK